MLTLSETRPTMDRLRKRVVAEEINRKQAAAILRTWIKESHKSDEDKLMNLFWEGWLT